jgi:hypothetical protein
MKKLAIGLMVGAMLAGCGGERPLDQADLETRQGAVTFGANLNLGSFVKVTGGPIIGVTPSDPSQASFIQQVPLGSSSGYGDTSYGTIYAMDSTVTATSYKGRDYGANINTAGSLFTAMKIRSSNHGTNTNNIECDLAFAGTPNAGASARVFITQYLGALGWNLGAAPDGGAGNFSTFIAGISSIPAADGGYCNDAAGRWVNNTNLHAIVVYEPFRATEPVTNDAGPTAMILEVNFPASNVTNRYYYYIKH